MSGINETREMIRAVGAVKREAQRLLADGFQFDDVTALWDKYENDASFKKLIDDAMIGWQFIGAELNDIDMFEGFQILREFLDAMKARMAQAPVDA